MMDYSLEHHSEYVGKKAAELPTPALVLSLPVVQANIAALHKDVETLGISFRPHVKTLKTIQVTRLMLGGGKYRSIIASTLAEIRGCMPLVQEGVLDEVLYGLPVNPGYLAQLAALRSQVRILLMVDNEQHVAALEKFGGPQPWDVFVKIDVGSRRAGIEAGSAGLAALVKRIEESPAARIYGFYCHAGHSYANSTRTEAEDTLQVELEGVVAAARLVPSDRELVISIGSTPTAHVVASLKASVPANWKLELHAGNFPANDLQQVSTGVITQADQAVRIATDVASVYPERNEALVNAGVVALSREPAHAFPGFGRVVGKADWSVVRMSQEHGILGTTAEGEKAERNFEVGQRVYLYCNHVCITAAAFYVYYVVNEDDVVVDTWLPWKGW
ncbi:hypothetical protein GQ53DRAFT_86869 [Thozetella sp. PMI_491]|nr:hypothetical protein GQ53DRAFT_86869 [Thozetella sp. PMI_491]